MRVIGCYVKCLKCSNRPIQFQECGVRHTWGGFQEQTKDDAMTQAYTCSWTKVGHSLKYSSFVMLWKPPRHGGQSDIMFLKLNWSIVWRNHKKLWLLALESNSVLICNHNVQLEGRWRPWICTSQVISSLAWPISVVFVYYKFMLHQYTLSWAWCISTVRPRSHYHASAVSDLHFLG